LGQTDVDEVFDGEPRLRTSRARGKTKQGGGGAPAIASEEDRQLDYSLRPRSLTEFIGQQRIKRVLGMSIEAARKRGEPLDHTLFSAPPGLGKTSLAHIIARELGVNLRVTSGPVSNVPATWPPSSAISIKAMCCLSMRFIAWREWSRRYSIPRWRTSS